MFCLKSRKSAMAFSLIPQSFFAVFFSIIICFPASAASVDNDESKVTAEPDMSVQPALAPSQDCETLLRSKGQALHLVTGSDHYYAIVHSIDSEPPAFHLVQFNGFDHVSCQYLQPVNSPDFKWPSPPLEIRNIWPKADMDGHTTGFYIFANTSQNSNSTSLLAYELTGDQVLPEFIYNLSDATVSRFKVNRQQCLAAFSTSDEPYKHNEPIPLGWKVVRVFLTLMLQMTVIFS